MEYLAAIRFRSKLVPNPVGLYTCLVILKMYLYNNKCPSTFAALHSATLQHKRASGSQMLFKLLEPAQIRYVLHLRISATYIILLCLHNKKMEYRWQQRILI